MKTQIQKLVIGLLLLSINLVAFGAPDGARPKKIFIGLADNYPPEAASKAQDAIVRLLLESPSGTEISVDDAVSMTAVAGPVVIPKLQFDSPIARTRQFTRQLVAVKQRFTQSATNRSAAGWLRIPEYLDFVAQRGAGENAVVLLLGSPLARYPAEESFTMTFDPPRVPTDAHLAAPSDETPYSTIKRVGRLQSVAVGWWHVDDRWFASDLHHDKVQNWWGKFVGTQGGQLRAFSPDLNTMISLALIGVSSATQNYQPDPSDSKVTMRVILPRFVPVQVPVAAPRVTVPVPSARPTTQPIESPARSEVIPVSPPPGRSAIGIAWLNDGAPVDFDLYVQPTAESQVLSFRLTSTRDGIYTFDDRQGSANNARAYEYVELKGAADPTQIHAWVNFFAGRKSPAKGRVVVFHQGRVREADFEIRATSGNNGADLNRRGDSLHWVELPVSEMMK